MNDCVYPGCREPAEFKIRDKLSLCEEHYNLFAFIDRLLFETRVEIDIRNSRFIENHEDDENGS